MMTPVKKFIKPTCGLACIESILKDHGVNLDQNDLIEKYPNLTKRGDTRHEGETDIDGLKAILTDLLSNVTFEEGRGEQFIRDNAKYKDNYGILITTAKDSDGKGILFHCWRLENILADSFCVVESEPVVPHSYMPHPWDQLTVRECSILLVKNG